MGKTQKLEQELLRLSDAGAAERTLHWGRNYLYQARLERPMAASSRSR